MPLHTVIFPAYILPSGALYKSTISARLYENDSLSLLRQSKHHKNWKKTIRYLFANLRYDQPEKKVFIKAANTQHEMAYNSTLQRFLCNFKIQKDDFKKNSVKYDHIELLPINGVEDSMADPYYLVNYPEKGISVISDIDDTIIHSNATSLLNGFRSVINGYQIVNNMDTLYSDLSKLGCNFHYITSSPDILFSMFYPLIRPKSVYKRFPFGTYHSISTHKHVLSSSHRIAHKVHHILQIITDFPNKDLILIGDNGQHDIQIYTQILQILGKDKHRVKAIYIRNINSTSSPTNTNSTQIPFKYFRDGQHLRELMKPKFEQL